MWLPPQRNARFWIYCSFNIQRMWWWTVTRWSRSRSSSGNPPVSTQHVASQWHGKMRPAVRSLANIHLKKNSWEDRQTMGMGYRRNTCLDGCTYVCGLVAQPMVLNKLCSHPTKVFNRPPGISKQTRIFQHFPNQPWMTKAFNLPNQIFLVLLPGLQSFGHVACTSPKVFQSPQLDPFFVTSIPMFSNPRKVVFPWIIKGLQRLWLMTPSKF